MHFRDILMAAAQGGGRAGIAYDFTAGALPSGVTLTRANATGTYFDVNGVMQTASANQARFDHHPVSHAVLGLLIEPLADQLVTWTEQFNTGWTPTNCTFDPNSANAPDGNATADTLIASAGSAVHRAEHGVTTSGVPTTQSVFAKANGYDFIYMCFFNDVPAMPTVWFNLATGAVATQQAGVTGAIQDVGNGLYRCSATVTNSYNGAGSLLYIGTSNADNVTSFNGDGASGAIIWGGGMVAEAAPSSYIASAGTLQTRGADVCSFSVPAGVTTLRYTFDDNTTQDVSVSAGAYTIPTNLNRSRIKTIVSV
jgi:hypothetical protein